MIWERMTDFSINDKAYDNIAGKVMDIDEFNDLIANELLQLIFIRRTAELSNCLDTQEYIAFEDAMNVISTMDRTDNF